MTSRKERKPASGKGRAGKGASGSEPKVEAPARARGAVKREVSPLRRDTPREMAAIDGAWEEGSPLPVPVRPRRPAAAQELPPRRVSSPRRDTPRDLPAVGGEGETPVARAGSVPGAPSASAEAVTRGALARVRGMETLEPAYDAWLELRLAYGTARLRFQEERERLDQQGSFLVGAVRAASQERAVSAEPAPAEESALTSGDAPMRDFLRQAEEKLARAREALAKEESESEARFQAAFEEIRSTVKDRVRRYLAGSPPRLKLLLRKVGATRVILHVERVGGDVPVLLLYLFAGRIPSRHGFLFDDSTEDVSLPPAPLYPEEGVAPAEVRPEAPALVARVRAPGEVLPVKGFLPVFVPRPEGGEDFFRLLQRGPVMEVEVAEGPGFRGVLTREESERFAGHLLRLKLEGRLELEVEAG
ncbi:MAG TPA: hypothetical protein VFZ09_09185 [Archangium sp.]|uniref:hypothetical protein n=1 Tax=Archangium sp. TaxID=1872627 RepID=UPI002E313D27|nr:hypothetical protein [Archangium sp.]HEX5746407.1 hypothetical protein [Archangium sp.]